MPIEQWSETVVVVRLADDPQFTEDMASLEPAIMGSSPDAVLDFAAVKYVNSSNIARLLRVRQLMVSRDARLILCNIANAVWSTFLMTGLDKVFTLSDNVTTSLATLQMA